MSETLWPPVPPEHLAPRSLLAYHYVIEPPFLPVVRPPGVTLTLVIEGAMGFTSPTGTTGVARRGDLVCFYPGITRYEVLGDQPLEKYSLYFQAGPAEYRLGVPSLPGAGLLPELTRVGRDLRVFISLYEKILQALLEFRQSWSLEVSAGILQLIQMIFDLHSGGSVSPRQEGDRWERLLSRLSRSRKSPSVRQLALEFALSTEQFIREFSRRTGKTPRQYILVEQLWAARRFLQGGSMVKEAAYQSGFTSLPHFSRLYRRQFGHPPSQTPSSDVQLLPDPGASLLTGRHFWAPGVQIQDFML